MSEINLPENHFLILTSPESKQMNDCTKRLMKLSKMKQNLNHSRFCPFSPKPNPHLYVHGGTKILRTMT